MKNLDIIRVLAVQKKMSLSDIAAKVGISPQGLNKIINTSNTTIATLEKIAEALDVPVAYFFDEMNGDVISVGDNSPGAGKDNSVSLHTSNQSSNNDVVIRFIDEIAAQRRLAEKAQQQVDDLLQILKSKMA